MTTRIRNGTSREKDIAFLYRFLKEHRLAVMATVTSDALPEAAVMGYAVQDNLDLICGTFITSRKRQNLQLNPRVALVIGWEKGITVQYEGIAEELNEAEAQEYLKQSFANVPSAAKFVRREYEVLYRITPRWVRYSDFSRDPWDQFELEFQH